MLNNGPDVPGADEGDGGDISNAPFEMMKDIRSSASFYSHAGGAVPVNSNSMSWNVDMVTTTGNVIIDLLHNFHLECGARLHKLRVYELLTQDNVTGREICGYLLVRGGVHAHAYALALKRLTGVDIHQMLRRRRTSRPTRSPSLRKYLQAGSHRRIYTFSPGDYQALAEIWSGEALPTDPPGWR